MGSDLRELSAMVGHQLPPVSVIIPFWLVLAYAGMIVLGPLLVADAQPVVLAAGHAAALVALLAWARRADPADPAAFTAFYMRVWGLFFLEYALVAAAVLAA